MFCVALHHITLHEVTFHHITFHYITAPLLHTVAHDADVVVDDDDADDGDMYICVYIYIVVHEMFLTCL